MKRALLSVSDKTGIEDVARRLERLGYQIVSTGGTQSLLQKAGLKVLSAEDVTHFRECLGGRVKTMHPLLLGGVLMKMDDPEHRKQAEDLGIEPISLVICNLYPFRKTMEDKTKTRDEVIEQIDVGGPTMLRSAAKNHASVTVICDPADYGRVLAELEKSGDTTPELRSELAGKVFLHTAAYDAMIAEYVSGGTHAGILLTRGQQLRYGENPHQWGKYYKVVDGSKAERQEVDPQATDLLPSSPSAPLPSSWGILHQGKSLSYLNILDADAAWSAVCEFTAPTAVLVKHANPSGIASHASIDEAFQRAYDADRLSAFGVIIALNRPCTGVIAQKILDQKIFTEVVVAPDYEPDALEILKAKPNIRVITQEARPSASTVLYRSVLGGMLVQNPDTKVMTEADLTCITQKKPTPEQIADLLFAWKVVKYAKSNAIVLAKDAVTLGIGCGQTSRVDSTWIALKRAGEKALGSVLASDAFFPFADSLEEAAKHGITAIIQPGGSIRDEEVFAKANELGISMVLTGTRAFRH
jgi:phosphoribosylaminoimidazolecarboxamide formyltransferase/IMP cyclohydrolase